MLLSLIFIIKLVARINIFKGSPYNCSNYRPISLLSNIDKIFEKLVYDKLIEFLDDHKIIHNKQFGFRRKHSTIHALCSLTEQIRSALDKGFHACGVFIDLQKAFDTVDHLILLKKLIVMVSGGLLTTGLNSIFVKSKMCQVFILLNFQFCNSVYI